MASKPQQILELNPPTEIHFKGPFDRVVTSFLEITNPSDEKVCFKVKTTAPRRYCVRPNSGIIIPGSKTRIAIMLQPIEQESQSERNKHKFMVQSTVISDEDVNLEELWKTVKTEDVMDSKLRCVFQTRSEGSQSPAIIDEQKQTDKNSHWNSKPTTNEVVPEVNLVEELPKSRPQILSTKNQNSEGIELQQTPTKPNKSAGDLLTRNLEQPITSTPTRPTRQSTAAAASVSTSTPMETKNLINRSEMRVTDKSMASSQNLTSSFLQPMSNDHKIVLISLIMLILGVIMGKYII